MSIHFPAWHVGDDLSPYLIYNDLPFISYFNVSGLDMEV
jgi:hypothetical protein